MKLLRASASFLAVLAVAPARAEMADAEQAIVELYKSDKLFDRNQYRAIRAAFARLFEHKQAAVLRAAYGDDHDKLAAWLDAHPDIKQSFYTALNEKFDKLPAALGLFREMWKKSPELVEKYPNLAVAVAVVWDDERRGVYDYRHHQVRTHSTLPENLVDALGNFEYLAANDKITEGRLRFLPWEFLVFVVDHRTPLKERGWAQGYYQKSKGTVASWHKDVPYDMDMLRGELQKGSNLKPHLEGREYTLAKIKSYGGVCAQQADFASRVGKSVGIPSVYCWGESTYRGLHAWWMFVQVQSATPDQLRFTLVSDGRIAGFIKDQLFTGFVVDPQSGQQMLDRDMERRLTVVGRDSIGRRQSDLLMRAYPWLSMQLDFTLKDRVAYLDRCLKVSASNEDAWREFIRLCKEEKTEPGVKAVALAHLETLFKTFASYPDFVARVLDDLLAVQPDPREQLRNYEQAIALYNRAGRPDLACAARLKITDLLCAQEKWQSAGAGLIATIRKYPTEGRYVPKMTARLQEVAVKYKEGPTALAKLYLELVPAMIGYYGKEGSTYCTKLSEQAEAFLQENNLKNYARELRTKTEQARLTAGSR
jgi:hypothetical protein